MDIKKERLEQLVMQHRIKDWSNTELEERFKADEQLAKEIIKLFDRSVTVS